MLPLILLATSGLAGASGLYKSVSAAIDHSKAKGINEDAQGAVRKSRDHVENKRKETNDVLTDYGTRKFNAFQGPIADFMTAFGRLKNIEEISTPELEKLQMGDFSTQTLDDLRHDYQVLMDSSLGLGAGLSSGAALAFGAYNGTMMLATASTGTAISSLSGVAATNATLAWLGGGSIATGGGGMALGGAVLGGLVAGPALLIFGHILGSKADAALSDAKSNMESAKTLEKEAMLAAENLANIKVITSLANSTFSKVASCLRKSVHELRAVIDTNGDDYRNYSPESKQAVFRSVKFAQLIKAMIDTPILDENGALILSTEKRIRDIGAIQY